MRRPNSHNAMGGHSGILAKGFCKELMNLITSEEYTFTEMYYFWHQKYERKAVVTDKSADEFTITLGAPDRFATVTCRGINGTWTGAVDHQLAQLQQHVITGLTERLTATRGRGQALEAGATGQGVLVSNLGAVRVPADAGDAATFAGQRSCFEADQTGGAEF